MRSRVVPPSSRCAPLSCLSSRRLASAECGPSGCQQEGAESSRFQCKHRGTGSLLARSYPIWWVVTLPVAREAGLALEVDSFYLTSLRRSADGREAGLSAMPSRSAAGQTAVIQRRAASADRERSVAFSHDRCEFSVFLFRSDCPGEITSCRRKQNPSRNFFRPLGDGMGVSPGLRSANCKGRCS